MSFLMLLRTVYFYSIVCQVFNKIQACTLCLFLILKKKKIPSDPWGIEYVYRNPGEHNSDEYDLYSYGSDGIEGEDDIVNWEVMEE